MLVHIIFLLTLLRFLSQDCMMNEIDSYELISDVKALNGKGLTFSSKRTKEKSACIANS